SMPSSSGGDESPNAPRGPARIGAALRKKWHEIRWDNIEVAYSNWGRAAESTHFAIFEFDKDGGTVTDDKTLQRVFERDAWLGPAASAPGLLRSFLDIEGSKERTRELWRFGGVPQDQIEAALAKLPEMSDQQRGADLQSAIEQCAAALKAV